MDESSHLFNYSIQDDGDGRYHQAFDDADLAHQRSYPPAFASAAFPNGLSSSMPSPKAARSAPHIACSMPARSSAQLDVGDFTYSPGVLGQTGRLEVPVGEGVKLESPGLSSGSSNTPDTRSSTQYFTPDYRVTALSSQPQQGTDDGLFARPSTAPPARRRRPRRLRAKEDVSMEEEDTKRNKFLERNRVAASKCRQKKKEWVSELEETKFGLESQNSHLQMEYSGLVDEVSRIRAQLMTHASCNDPNIDKWIENEAKRFVIGAGERFDAMLANFGPTVGAEHRHESMSSNSAYQAANTNELLSPTTQRGSMSLPTSAGLPSSPFFRGAFASDGTSLTAVESSYIPTRVGEGMSDFDHLHVTDSLS